MQDLLFRLTFDSITMSTFGVDFDSVGNEEQHSFPRAFDEISNLCQKRFVDAFYIIKRWFQIGRRERRIRELKKVIDDYAEGMISQRKVAVSSSHGKIERHNNNNVSNSKQSFYQMDILSRYIDHANRAGVDIPDEELRDVVMNILLAGRDTTACALSWTWYELTRHPAVVNKIISEVELICGCNENADYSFENINKLQYTHCVALETLRLHPPVAIDPRFTVRDSTLPDGTNIPAGAGINMCFHASGRSESIWGKDALLFIPERFFHGKEGDDIVRQKDTRNRKVQEPSPFKFPMFNAGPRMCLGKPLALMNMKLTMAMLLPVFKFNDKKRHNGEYVFGLVQSMKGDLPLQISKRVAMAK